MPRISFTIKSKPNRMDYDNQTSMIIIFQDFCKKCYNTHKFKFLPPEIKEKDVQIDAPHNYYCEEHLTCKRCLRQLVNEDN